MTRSVERGELPGGSLLLMHEGEVIFDQGFGYAHIRRKSPFTADAPVRVASLSKSIIATLIVRLDARRALDLDRPIDGYLPRLLQLRLTTGKAPQTHAHPARVLEAHGGLRFGLRERRAALARALQPREASR
jgi:CubicO group peptidase (beta-lactamase class C family)